jgi:hypothetical protein
MNLVKHAWFVYFGLGALAIAPVIVGESYKVAWVANWLAPILFLLCFVSLSTLSHKPDASAPSRSSKLASYARTTAVAVVLFLFIMIEIVSDAPVTLRLMGMSWTMSAYAATRVFTLGGLALVALGIWVTQKQARRDDDAAIAKGASGQAPPTPASSSSP